MLTGIIDAWFRLYTSPRHRRPRTLAVAATPALVLRKEVDRSARAAIYHLDAATGTGGLHDFAARVMQTPGLPEAAARAAKVTPDQAEAAVHLAAGVARSFDHSDVWAPISRVYVTFLDNLCAGLLPPPVARAKWRRYLNLVLSNTEPFRVATRSTALRYARRRARAVLRPGGTGVGDFFDRLAGDVALLRAFAGKLRLEPAQVADCLRALGALPPSGGPPPAEGQRRESPLPPAPGEVADLWSHDAKAYAARLRAALDRYLLVPASAAATLDPGRKSMAVHAEGFPHDHRAVPPEEKAAAESFIDTTIISLVTTPEELRRILSLLPSPAQLTRFLTILTHHFFRDDGLLLPFVRSPLFRRCPDAPWKHDLAARAAARGRTTSPARRRSAQSRWSRQR
jgi:hypothetical protein